MNLNILPFLNVVVFQISGKITTIYVNGKANTALSALFVPFYEVCARHSLLYHGVEVLARLLLAVREQAHVGAVQTVVGVFRVELYGACKVVLRRRVPRRCSGAEPPVCLSG